MNQEIKKIQFGEDELLGVKTEDGRICLAVRRVCLNIGLSEKQADNEVKKVKNSLLFENEWQELTLKFEGQGRKTTILTEKFVPMWLAQIILTPVMKSKHPIATEKLLKYQREVVDVLEQAFTSTEEKKEEFYSTLGIEGKIEELSNEMAGLTEQVTLLIDSATINSRQAQKLLEVARYRVKSLLGNVDSIEYKKNARKYFKRMWNNFAEFFETNTYKDLNPLNMDSAIEYLHQWNFIGA